jgi:uncharacterized protein (DUF305 family)
MASLTLLRRATMLAVVVAAAVPATAHDRTHPGDGAPTAAYAAENDAAMATMMHDMAVPSTGDVDRDFVAMMVAHHQGAIDMARALLRHGHNEQLRRIAQEIIVDQMQEIAAMKLAVGDPVPTPRAAPTQP